MSGGTSGTGSSGSTGSTGGPPNDSGDPPQIGTPPGSDTRIHVPYGREFIYVAPLPDGIYNDGPNASAYWRWYWYTYLRWSSPEQANGHPHPPIGSDPRLDIIPYPHPVAGGDFVYSDTPIMSGRVRNPFVGQHVRPGDPDYAWAHWVWYDYFGNSQPGGGTTGSTTGGTGGGTTGGNPVVDPVPIDPGSSDGRWQNADWEVSVVLEDAPNTRRLVTGTKNDLTFRVRYASKFDLQRPSSVTVKTLTIKKIEYYVGGQSDNRFAVVRGGSDQTLSNATAPALYNEPRNANNNLDPARPEEPNGVWVRERGYLPRVRFGSTRFGDGETIPVCAVVTIGFGNGQGADTSVVVTSPCYVFEAYNKGLALATKQIYNLSQEVYQTMATREPGNYDWGSKIAIVGLDGPDDGSARARLTQMNHSNLGPADGIMRKGEILTALGESTAFFAYTHGEPSCMLASCGNNDNDPYSIAKLSTDQGVESEIGRAVWHPQGPTRPRRAPRPNLVVMHACNGLENSWRVGQAYGILTKDQDSGLDGQQVREGRAFTGFPYVVDTPSFYEPNTFLYEHARLIYKRLREGWTVKDAVDQANRAVVPAGLSTNFRGDIERKPMPMKYKGDPYTRLFGVYTGELGQAPKNADGSFVWHLILKPLDPQNTVNP